MQDYDFGTAERQYHRAKEDNEPARRAAELRQRALEQEAHKLANVLRKFLLKRCINRKMVVSGSYIQMCASTGPKDDINIGVHEEGQYSVSRVGLWHTAYGLVSPQHGFRTVSRDQMMHIIFCELTGSPQQMKVEHQTYSTTE